MRLYGDIFTYQEDFLPHLKAKNFKWVRVDIFHLIYKKQWIG